MDLWIGHNSLLRSLMAIASDSRLKWKAWQNAGVLADGTESEGRLACSNSRLRKINVEPGEGSSALKEGTGSGAEQTRSTGQSFKSADWSQQRWWKHRRKQPCPSVRKAQDHVGRRTETDHGSATCVGRSAKLLSERSKRNGTSFSTFRFTDISFSPWILH